MTEQEEFEFRARAEAEAAAGTAAPVTFSGSMSEVNKAIGRGIVSLPLAVGKGLENAVPPSKEGDLIQFPEADPNITAMRERLLANLKATPRNKFEQMLGTGVELGTAALPFSGGAGTIPQKLLGLGLPVAGGVTGEQLGGEQGKMIGSLGAPVGAALLGRALSPNVSADMAKLVAEGVAPTPGQQTGGFLKKFEDFPIIKEFTGPAKARAEAQFLVGATNTALKPLGAKVSKVENGFDAYEKASRIASDKYDEILPQIKFSWDSALSNERRLMQTTLQKDTKEYMDDFFKTNVRPHIDPKTGAIDPRQMKKIDSELGKLIRDAQRDPAMEKRALTEALHNFQGMVRDSVTRQNPALAPELTKINTAWNNLVRIGDAVKRAGANNGNFTPRQLQQSVMAMDTSLRKQNFVKGRAAMQEFSSAGVNVLGSSATPHVPYSALSSIARSTGPAVGAGAAAAALPATASVAVPIAAAAGTLGAMYSSGGQRLAQVALTGPRPPALQTFGETLRGLPPGPTLGTLPLFTQGEQ